MSTDTSIDHRRSPVNLDVPERIASVLAGASLLYKNRDELSIAKAAVSSYLIYRGLSGFCYAYGIFGKEHLPNPAKNINIRTSVTVNKPRYEVYRAWRKLENLPRFMKHLETVTELDEKKSIWKVHVPASTLTIEWEAQIVKDIPGEFLGWSSLPDANIENAGKVTFEDAGQGMTEVVIIITYRAPLGVLGEGIARLFNNGFEKLVEQDLAGFKNYMEALPDPGTII